MSRKSLFGQLVHELIEVTHRFPWIRSFGQKTHELLDHGDGGPQLFLCLGVLDLAPPSIRYKELILRFLTGAPYFDFVNVDTLHRKRARNSVQKSERVFGLC